MRRIDGTVHSRWKYSWDCCSQPKELWHASAIPGLVDSEYKITKTIKTTVSLTDSAFFREVPALDSVLHATPREHTDYVLESALYES